MGRPNERELNKIVKEAIKPTKYCLFCHTELIKQNNTYMAQRMKFCSDRCGNNWRKEHNKKQPSNYRIAYLKVRFSILSRDNFTCQYCGASPRDGIKLEIDHIIPKNKGGLDTEDNLITSCQNCNLGKGDVLLNAQKERDNAAFDR